MLTAKAGVPATTGSQATPAPDSGNVGLYVVTVAYGQTQIVAGNISLYSGAPFINILTMAQIQSQTGTAFTAGGTAPAYTLTPSPAIAAYAAGQRLRVAFGSAGTTGSNTINISGQGAKSLMQYDSNGTLVPAVIPAGLLSDVEYNGSVMVLLDPVAGKTSVAGAARNVRMYLAAASATATITADEVIVETALGGAAYQLASLSKTLNLATTGIGGMDTGTAPVSGYVAIYAAYNPTTGASGVFAANATSAAAGNVYGGANAPAGYTATALLTVVPTNASGQIKPCLVRDRRVSLPSTSVLSTSTTAGSYTSLSIAGAVPANAVSVRGSASFGSSSASTLAVSIGGDSAGIDFSYGNGSSVLGGASTFDVQMAAAQTIYYTFSSTSGTPSLNIFASGYTI